MALEKWKEAGVLRTCYSLERARQNAVKFALYAPIHKSLSKEKANTKFFPAEIGCTQIVKLQTSNNKNVITGHDWVPCEGAAGREAGGGSLLTLKDRNERNSVVAEDIRLFLRQYWFSRFTVQDSRAIAAAIYTTRLLVEVINSTHGGSVRM